MRHIIFKIRMLPAILFWSCFWFISFSQTAKAQEYPPCILDIAFPIYGTPGGAINITSLPTNLPNSFGIMGTLIVNQSTTWTQKQVKMFGGAQIRISPGMTFELDGTILEGCDQMWKGVYLGGNADIILHSSARISDAVSGIESRGLNSISIENSTLTRNFYGLNCYNSTSSWEYQLEKMTIDGAGPLKLPYLGQPTDLYGPRGRAGIFFSNMNEFWLFSNPQSNIVKRCEIGAWFKNCTGLMTGFKFEDILWYHVKPLGIAVLIQGGVVGHPDGIIVSSCTILNSNMGFDIDNARFTLIADTMTTVNTGIRARNAFANEGSQIFDCVVDGANNGFQLGPNPNSIITLDNNLITKVAGYGLYVTDQTNAVNNSKYDISRCTVSIEGNAALSPRNNDDAIGIWATQLAVIGSNLKFESNYVYLPGTNTGTNNIGIYVTNCHSATFKKNHVIQDVPNAGAGHTAMYYQNTNFTYIECNDFLNTDVGLVVAGTQNSPTVIRTNQFKYHTSVGMLFQDGITTAFNNADHVHRGNLWLYPTDASNPGAISTLSSNANEFMQFYVDAAENPAFLPYVSGANWFVDHNNGGTTPTCDPYSGLLEGNSAERTNELARNSKIATGIDLNIAPNPSSGDITMSWAASNLKIHRLELVDLYGRVVFSEMPQENQSNWRVSGLMPGVYFCRVADAGGTNVAVSKVIVRQD